MARLRPLTPEEMSPEQSKLLDDIANSPRQNRMVGGPSLAWIRNPEAGQIAQQLGAFCRFKTGLTNDVLEIAICTVARHWSQPYEWWAHKRNALKVNVDSAIIDAIENRARPKFASEQQAAAHDLAKELLETKVVSRATYERALGLFGEKTLVELTQVIGYYTNIALQMNCFEVAPAEDGALKDAAVR